MFRNPKRQITIALLYFFITASLGVFLRFFPIVNFSTTYRFIVHTHSHIALLGWVYTALISSIHYIFLKDKKPRTFYKIFWFTQFTIVGMLFSFPFHGYAFLSITFTTFFLIASYWFVYYFFKHIPDNLKNKLSYKFIRFSLLLMILSSIGPWTLGIIMSTLGKSSIWYRISIYFYLHFQYNGWFIFGLFGLFFFLLEQHKIILNKKFSQLFYRLMIVSVFLTFFLSVLFTKPHSVFYILAFIGSLLQLIAAYYFLRLIQDVQTRTINPISYKLFRISFWLFILKIILQNISATPYFADLASHQLNFVIGYIHLTFLGVISISLLALMHHFKLMQVPKQGILLFIFGFFTSEILIFYKGFAAWLHLYELENYFVYLIIASICMALGIVLFLLKNLSSKNTTTLKQTH